VLYVVYCVIYYNTFAKLPYPANEMTLPPTQAVPSIIGVVSQSTPGSASSISVICMQCDDVYVHSIKCSNISNMRVHVNTVTAM
jgi:hypothetical protein